MSEYYDKKEEHKALHKGCFIPFFIIATSFLLISLVHNSKKEEKSIINNQSIEHTTQYNGLPNPEKTINDASKGNNIKDKIKKELESFRSKLPKKVDENTIIKDLEYTGNDIYFKYTITNDYADSFINCKNLNANLNRLLKRKFERDVTIETLKLYKEYNYLNITYHHSYYDEIGNKILSFKLYTEYINRKVEIYEINGKLYNIPYDKERDFIKKIPSAKIPNDTIGYKYTYYDAILNYNKKEQTITYYYNNKVYEIPKSLEEEFLKDCPEAKTYEQYIANKGKTICYEYKGDLYDIPESEVKRFLSQYPNAKLYVEKSNDLNILKDRIRNFCKEINKSLPIRIDDYTQLETVLFSGKIIHMRYTVSDIVKEIMDDELKRQQKQDVKVMLRNMLKEFGGVLRDLEILGVKLHYIYTTKNGDVVLQFTISPKELN